MTPRAALLQLLTVARQWQAAAFQKAKPVEPGRAEKLAAERKLAALFTGYFARLGKKAAAKLRADPPAQDKSKIEAGLKQEQNANGARLKQERGKIEAGLKQERGKKAVRDWWDEDEFWEDDDFLADLLSLITAAVRGGVILLTDMIDLDLDLTATNKEAAAAAREYVYDLVKGITDTSRDALREAVSAFVETPGMTIGDVIAALPFDEQRAALIATTEITRAYATGQAAAGDALKEQYPDVRVVKTWYTNVDDRVCPICGPLHLVSAEMDEDFGGEFDGPPGHPGCRCWVTYGTRL